MESKQHVRVRKASYLYFKFDSNFKIESFRDSNCII